MWGKAQLRHLKPVLKYLAGSIYAGGNSLTVSGTVNGAACEITVDTGSNISIVRPGGMDQDLIEPVNSCLRTVTGERAPIHGKSQLHLGIQSLLVPQELWVADIHNDCILGLFSLMIVLSIEGWSSDYWWRGNSPKEATSYHGTHLL